MSRTRHIELNRELWESWTRLHVKSAFYDVEGFKQNPDRLDEVVRTGIGDVAGKSLLHLQCHFGLDTLALARRGARVTGIDFSAEAVEYARRLAAELEIDARFVCCDIYELAGVLDEEFEVVFTSHGVLGWLPDIGGWARTVAAHLAPGGRFFMAELHPVAAMFDETREDRDLTVQLPYFHEEAPLEFVEKGTYAAPEAEVESTGYYWNHTLSDIIGSLLRTGLTLTAFEEYPFLEWRHFPWMEQSENGSWVMPADRIALPLMFSLEATKPGRGN